MLHNPLIEGEHEGSGDDEDPEDEDLPPELKITALGNGSGSVSLPASSILGDGDEAKWTSGQWAAWEAAKVAADLGGDWQLDGTLGGEEESSAPPTAPTSGTSSSSSKKKKSAKESRTEKWEREAKAHILENYTATLTFEEVEEKIVKPLQKIAEDVGLEGQMHLFGSGLSG